MAEKVQAAALEHTALGHTALAHSAKATPPAGDSHAAALAKKIEHAIRRSSAGRVHKLRVEVVRDVVFLRGFCSTFYVKQLAQHAAMPLSEGHTLQNQIEVW